MTWFEITIAIVALYGAALSTYNIVERLKDKLKKIRVDISASLLEYAAHISDAQLSFKASNPTSKEVILQPPELIIPDKGQIFLRGIESNIRFPYKLAPNNSCLAWNDLKGIVKTLKDEGYEGTIKVKGQYRDAVGNKYRSKPMKINLDEESK